MDVNEPGTTRVGDVLIRQSPGVVEATIDRPRVFNALNDGVVTGLEHAVAVAAREDAIVLVLRGAGGNFCSGADLKYVRTLFGNLESGLFPYIDRLRRICDAIANGPFASLAVVEGYALAGGYEILTACDMAVATSDASIGDRHLEYALAPGLGATVRIARQLTSKQARYLAFTGNIISGTQAAAWGLVSHAWPKETFEQETSSLVARLATRSREALRLYKRMLLSGERDEFQDALAFEARAFREYQTNFSDARDGVARFQEKR
jgi:enoyl-CoA hydratase/carnithine racemase